MTKTRNTRAAITASAALATPSTEAVAGSGGPDAGSVGTASDPASTPTSTVAAEVTTAPVALAADAVLAGQAITIPAVPTGDTGADDLGNEEIEGLELGGRIIMVRSVSDRGRRRAGIAFGPVPQPVEVDDLTEDQLGGLLADPQLIVSLDD